MRERPLYGPHPTQPHTSTHTQRVVSGQPRQPDNRITLTTIKTAHALPVQSSRWSQRQGNARHSIPNPEAKPDSADGTAPARERESRTPPSTHHTAGPGTANNSGPGPTALHTHQQNHHPQTTVRSTASARHAACCWGSLRLRASVQVGSSQVFKDSGGTDGSPGVKEGLWRIRTVSTARTTARQVGVAATVSVTASAHAALSQRRTVAFAVAIMRDGTTTPTAPADIPIG